MYYRDTWAEINLDAIKSNIQQTLALYPRYKEVYVALKANAYGHGYAEVAEAVLKAGATRILVAFIDEGIYLRNAGIEAPILVLGASRPTDVLMAIKHNLTLTAYNVDWLEKIADNLKNDESITIHLKFDTGMGRIGLRTKEEWIKADKILDQHPNIVLEGVFTHFATADELDRTYFNEQLSNFKEKLKWIEESDRVPSLIHCSNSAATILAQGLFNAVRMGIVTYGLAPSIEMTKEIPFTLQPALSLHTKITHVKQLQANKSISYGATYSTKGNEWIATIPIGYADGWLRDMQDFNVLVDGKKVQIVGRVCMDQCMIRLPDFYPIGTKVTLIGTQGDQTVTAEDVAAHMNTINYEVTCLVNHRVPRIFIEDNHVKSVKNFLLEDQFQR
jgi:alanine racemase